MIEQERLLKTANGPVNLIQNLEGNTIGNSQELALELLKLRELVAKAIELEDINYGSTYSEIPNDAYFTGLQNGIAIVCAVLAGREPKLYEMNK